MKVTPSRTNLLTASNKDNIQTTFPKKLKDLEKVLKPDHLRLREQMLTGEA
jgi:hypothetical protein